MYDFQSNKKGKKKNTENLNNITDFRKIAR